MKKFFMAIMLLAVATLGCSEKLAVQASYYDPYPLAFYNAFWEQKIPDVTFRITNPTDRPITVKITSEYVGISNPAISTLVIPPKKTVTINQTIPLIPEKIKEIKAKTKICLHYKVEYRSGDNWKTWCEQTVMVDVYPLDVMVWVLKCRDGRRINMQDYIAVFVTPDDRSVQELLAKAKEFAPNHELKGAKDKILPQIEAIFNALKYDYNVSYVNTPFTYGRDYVQRVRLPAESLRLRAINCVDGAVLFASAMEALGIKPYIVLLPNHAFVAWIDSHDKLMFALETTLINSSFSVALNKGLEELNKNWKNLTDDNPWNGYLVNIEACREVGIVPLPLD